MVCRLFRVLNARRKAFALIPALVAIVLLGAPALSASAAARPAMAPTVTPLPAADLAVTNGLRGIPTYGGSMAEAVTVTNNGPDPATTVVVTAPTPRSPWAARPTTFLCVGSGTAWCGPLLSSVKCTKPPIGSPGTVTCTTNSLQKGASMTISVEFRVGFYLHNSALCASASATSATFDPDTGNNGAQTCVRAN
jgi:hypothetical protein